MDTVSLHEKPKSLDELCAALLVQAIAEGKMFIGIVCDPSDLEHMKFTTTHDMHATLDLMRAIVKTFNKGKAQVTNTRSIRSQTERKQ